MEPRIIDSESQYRRYLDEVARLAAADPEPESPEGKRLLRLAELVEDYEKNRWNANGTT